MALLSICKPIFFSFEFQRLITKLRPNHDCLKFFVHEVFLVSFELEHAYPTNKEILNENQQKKYCYTFPLRLKVLFVKFHLRSVCSLYTLQLMDFAFCNAFWEQLALIYGNPINQFTKVCDFKNDWGKFVRSKSIHDGLSEFLKHVESLIKLCRWYVPQKFSVADSVIFRIAITYNKEIVVYFHLRIQYFFENIQMIWDKIFMRV